MFTVHPNSSNASGNALEDGVPNKYVFYTRVCLMSGSLILIAIGIPGRQSSDHHRAVGPMAEGPEPALLPEQPVWRQHPHLTSARAQVSAGVRLRERRGRLQGNTLRTHQVA